MHAGIAALGSAHMASKKVVHVVDAAAYEAYTRATRSDGCCSRRAWGHTLRPRGPYVEGGRTDRCFHRVPPRSSPLYEQADRAGYKFCRPGRHRRREHASAPGMRERTGELEVQSREVIKLNQQLEQRVADQVGEIGAGQSKIAKVMREWKEGSLRSGSKHGP
jgi:hypothetical protein